MILAFYGYHLSSVSISIPLRGQIMLAFMKVLQPKTVEEAYELATKTKLLQC